MNCTVSILHGSVTGHCRELFNMAAPRLNVLLHCFINPDTDRLYLISELLHAQALSCR